MSGDLLIQQPAQPVRLVLLFHGVGGEPANLQALARQLASEQPDAWVIVVCAPQPCDLGQGWQWFSVRGVDDDNRAGRVAAAMPAFEACIRYWQQLSELDAAHTWLIGFSQGAIMALESTQLDQPPAAQVVALAGRLARAPRRADPQLSVHLLHGSQDAVIAPQCSRDAASALLALGGRVNLQTFEGLGHAIDSRVTASVGQLLAAEG